MTRKFAVSFPDEVYQRARDAADAAGTSLSGWLSHAAEQELTATARRADGLSALDEFEANNGTISPDTADRAWVANVLDSATAQQKLAG